MNKKQAKILALEIATCLINKEWASVSDLTVTVIEEGGFNPDDNKDFSKVLLALADIEAELSLKKERFLKDKC